MAEFLRLKSQWLNVDKIARVENFGTPSEPNLTVYYFGGEKVPIQDEDAEALIRYLNGSPAKSKK